MHLAYKTSEIIVSAVKIMKMKKKMAKSGEKKSNEENHIEWKLLKFWLLLMKIMMMMMMRTLVSVSDDY